MDLSETARDGIDSRRDGAAGAPAMAYMPSRRLQGRIALINCGDGTFARSVALCFALEGARVALCNHGGTGVAREIRREIRSHGGTCLVLQEQCRGSDACLRLVEHVVAQLGALDILVNSGNTTVEPGDDQLSRIEATFRSSTFPYLYLMTAALPYLPAGGCVINSSLLASGGGDCIDPDTDAAESAIVALTRSFARAAAARGIRVNAISRSTMGRSTAGRSMADRPMARSLAGRSNSATDAGLLRAGRSFAAVAQPLQEDLDGELGPTCVFLASADAALISGQTFYLNRGGFSNG